VNLSVSSNTGSEAAGSVITVTATASSVVSGDQTVDLLVTGAGVSVSDYSLSNTTITINDGQTTGSITFTVQDDALVEGAETATISLTNPSAGLNLGSTVSQNIVITDSDFELSGNLSGFDTHATPGDSITLQNNGGDDLIISTDGAFNFSSILLNNAPYAVTVKTNPTMPNQTCLVSGGNSGQNDGTGQIAGSNYTDIVVTCSINQYSVGGTLSGLINGTLTLQNNTANDLQLSSNGAFEFTTELDDLSSYVVTLINNTSDPQQSCILSGGNSGQNDGAGSLVGADVLISVDCNTPLTTVDNIYTAFEDITLLANDADGSVTGVNDDGVLVNDSDLDGDTLMVVAPGIYAATGLGGQVTLAIDGTFSYVPPADISGQDVLTFDVTDGIHTVGSSLTIDVLPVNDAPTFSILGNVLSAELHPNIVGNTLTIPQFAFDMYAGADDESSQTLQFTPSIFADSNSILNVSGVSITNTGELTLDFTGNIGLAIVQLTLQDDGLQTNGGEDTSVIAEFVVSFSDTLFVDDFEELQVIKLFNFLDGVKSKGSLMHYPSYDESSHSLNYYQSTLKLGEDYLTPQMIQVIKSWISEIEVEMSEVETKY
jgi:hypothetical protein